MTDWGPPLRPPGALGPASGNGAHGVAATGADTPGRSAAIRADAPGEAAAGPDALGRGAEGVLVIGYGNTLRSDDGVGPRVAAVLAADPRLAGATVTATQQLTPELARDFAAARLVVLVDASSASPPGAVAARRVEEIGDPGASSHHVHPGTLAGLARELYGVAPEAFVVSIGVADLAPGERLSPAVAEAIPAAAATVLRLLAEHGAIS